MVEPRECPRTQTQNCQLMWSPTMQAVTFVAIQESPRQGLGNGLARRGLWRSPLANAAALYLYKHLAGELPSLCGLMPAQAQLCERCPGGVVQCWGHGSLRPCTLWLCSGQDPPHWAPLSWHRLSQPLSSPFTTVNSAFLSPEMHAAREFDGCVCCAVLCCAALLVAARQGGLRQCSFLLLLLLPAEKTRQQWHRVSINIWCTYGRWKSGTQEKLKPVLGNPAPSDPSSLFLFREQWLFCRCSLLLDSPVTAS